MRGSAFGPDKKRRGLLGSDDLGLSSALATIFSRYDKENIIHGNPNIVSLVL